jgi:alpha-mannosidase
MAARDFFIQNYWILLFTIFLFQGVSSTPSNPPIVGHIIPHSHCDGGWLDTFETYYLSQVSTILTRVVNSLKDHPERKFIWAEISFWMRWYETQSEEIKTIVHGLVKSGQIEFVGGGWVQNDEANPDFASMIAQISEGHEYLKTLFGVRARYAWQIDPVRIMNAMIINAYYAHLLTSFPSLLSPLF